MNSCCHTSALFQTETSSFSAPKAVVRQDCLFSHMFTSFSSKLINKYKFLCSFQLHILNSSRTFFYIYSNIALKLMVWPLKVQWYLSVWQITLPLMCYYIFFPLESQFIEYSCHEFEMFWEYNCIEHVK
jgi:hypothetical protein